MSQPSKGTDESDRPSQNVGACRSVVASTFDTDSALGAPGEALCAVADLIDEDDDVPDITPLGRTLVKHRVLVALVPLLVLGLPGLFFHGIFLFSVTMGPFLAVVAYVALWSARNVEEHEN
jgi:hypothetical protein